MIEFLSQPWHWSVSGALIALLMVLLLWFGGKFGVSSNLRTFCTIAGAGKVSDFFVWDWKAQIWNLVFIMGAVIGGFLASHYLISSGPLNISASTVTYLSSVGITTPQDFSNGGGFVPEEIFSDPFSLKGIIILIIGGFFIGFGTRYAGGCTSGHAISGLSNLQLPSLIAVVGFFIGGLAMTWLILPSILNLQ